MWHHVTATTIGAPSVPVVVYIQTAVLWAVCIYYTQRNGIHQPFSFFLGANPVVVYLYGVPIWDS